MRNVVCRLMLMLAIFGFAAPAAHAAGFGGIREATLYPLFQYFTWEEFEHGTGTKLLKESGMQYGAGGNLKLGLLQGDAGTMTLNMRAELFGGEVDYDGHLQNGTPHKTDVDYFGMRNEMELGWAIPLANVTVEPFGGLGYRWWNRELKGDGGYTESWSTLYTMLGAECRYKLASDSVFTVRGGGVYRFDNHNRVDYPGSGTVDIEPGNDWSVKAEATFRYKSVFATLYYENFIFSESAMVPVYNTYHGSILLYQPRSESEITGLRVGWAFK